MNPKLIVIAGPQKGAVFELSEDKSSVGREIASTIRLADPSVSRQHCLLQRDEGRFKVVDLDSFNGTFVNGVPVHEQFLDHGDHITIGDLLLLFLVGESEAADAPTVRLNEEEMVTQSTTLLRKQDAFYLQHEKVLAALPPTARIARDLSALLKISTIINSVRELKELQRRLLESILEVVPAERAAILIAGNNDELVLAACVGELANEELTISKLIVGQALREGAAIMSNDVTSVNRSGNVEASPMHAVLCVPLVVQDKGLGVIYFDRRNSEITFDDHHLQLAIAIASIAAIALEHAEHAEKLEGENQRLTEEINIKHQMIGDSTAMRELYRFIAKVAPSDSSVLLRGESGTGKELAARALHQNSTRERNPFVAINCATLSESLLESELFGHEKGAFTGAVAQKRGKLEIANGGTLFLDEVGELAPNIQAKLLRVLQEREFERVGGTRPISINIRIIAATNRDLEEAVRSGGFRRDLYYRLNVISFTLPPLRERRGDIPLLTNYFVAECSKRVKRKPLKISAEARSYLKEYSWPGNVRELQNVIERAIVLSTTDTILPEDFPETLLETTTSGSSTGKTFYDALRETKKQMVLDALERAQGNYAEAAKTLGIHTNNLHRLIRNLNLKYPPDTNRG